MIFPIFFPSCGCSELSVFPRLFFLVCFLGVSVFLEVFASVASCSAAGQRPRQRRGGGVLSLAGDTNQVGAAPLIDVPPLDAVYTGQGGGDGARVTGETGRGGEGRGHELSG